MECGIRNRPIRSGRCGCAARPVDAAPAVTAATPTIERNTARGHPFFVSMLARAQPRFGVGQPHVAGPGSAQ
jgi:hypothetical protein